MSTTEGSAARGRQRAATQGIPRKNRGSATGPRPGTANHAGTHSSLLPSRRTDYHHGCRCVTAAPAAVGRRFATCGESRKVFHVENDLTASTEIAVIDTDVSQGRMPISLRNSHIVVQDARCIASRGWVHRFFAAPQLHHRFIPGRSKCAYSCAHSQLLFWPSSERCFLR